MSRTYRRKNAEYLTHSYLDRWDWHYEREDRHLVKVYYERSPREMKKRRAVYHSDSFRTMTTPMWFNRLFCQVPQRCRERDLCRDLVKHTDLDELDLVIFPLWKPPQEYYW